MYIEFNGQNTAYVWLFNYGTFQHQVDFFFKSSKVGSTL